MKTGICFGNYMPLLRGELDLIMQAKKQCDRCVIAASPEAAENLHRLLGESKEVTVVTVTDLPSIYEIETAVAPYTEATETVWFVQPQYRDRMNGRQAVFGGEDSSPVYRQAEAEAPCRRIMITGWASEGKSTLARDIATYFCIPYVPEAARVYMEERHLKDEELTEEDFLQFIRLQNKLTDEAKDIAAVVDTDNITTLAYTISYAADPDVTAITDESIRRIREEVRIYDWEHIYVLPPKNTYVDDGLRYMKQADLDVRNENFSLLLRLLEEYGLKDKIVFLTGNYWENFVKVREDMLKILQK